MKIVMGILLVLSLACEEPEPKLWVGELWATGSNCSVTISFGDADLELENREAGIASRAEAVEWFWEKCRRGRQEQRDAEPNECVQSVPLTEEACANGCTICPGPDGWFADLPTQYTEYLTRRDATLALLSLEGCPVEVPTDPHGVGPYKLQHITNEIQRCAYAEWRNDFRARAQAALEETR